MTYISEVSEDRENLERLRREILQNVESRREDSNNAFSEFIKFSGIVYSGGAIAVLSFIASRKENPVSSVAIVSFGVRCARLLFWCIGGNYVNMEITITITL